ncbi:MAG: hypothetical protein JXP72_03560 [Coriobacteriia bacterium]|nr:hypothetical protein [Coriobacteriia bacterium]
MDARDVIERLARLLEDEGYTLERRPDGSLLATKRGHSAGVFLPYTDFIFLHDLDGAFVADAGEFEEQHQANRAEGEAHMSVPRPLRYRVPNSVTVGVTARPASEAIKSVATEKRDLRANTGEKNSVYLVDLSAGTFYSQGLEVDRFSLHGGEWSPDVNPSNRVARMLAQVLAEAFPQ